MLLAWAERALGVTVASVQVGWLGADPFWCERYVEAFARAMVRLFIADYSHSDHCGKKVDEPVPWRRGCSMRAASVIIADF